jgi:hypothetical protein
MAGLGAVVAVLFPIWLAVQIRMQFLQMIPGGVAKNMKKPPAK